MKTFRSLDRFSGLCLETVGFLSYDHDEINDELQFLSLTDVKEDSEGRIRCIVNTNVHTRCLKQIKSST